MTETTAFGEAFLRDWYRKIDGKAPFSELARLTVGEGLVVDFPNNPLDMAGFERWYAAQCRDFCGEHCIHSIKVTEDEDAIVISRRSHGARRTRRARPSSLPRM